MLTGKRLFVTGGAGYIGSHAVKALIKAGCEVRVYDNLSTGHRWAIDRAELVVGDLGDRSLLRDSLQAFNPDAIIHFAAFIEVGESVTDPLKYYRNNTLNALNLYECAQELSIDRVIFSSTAAVYGEPEEMPVAETTPLNPINPYGASKMMSERLLADLAAACDSFRSVALRYFNVAGADTEGELGQAYNNATHLITRAVKTAKGESDKLRIFGTDYPTADGTCLRDYIHVDDLAQAHLSALRYLLAGGASDTFNCGYGHGYSVREVIDVAKRVSGVDFTVADAPRRAGDPPQLIADNRKILASLDWRPQHNNLEFIIRTAWEWETVGLAKKKAS